MKRKQTSGILRKAALILWSVCLIGGISVSMNAQNAASILDNAAAAYEKSNGISASYAVHTRSDAQKASESFEGTIQMKGDKFVLVTPDATTWFNGETQWSYVERNEEVNVTTPSGDELQFTNPALLLKTYKKGFTAKFIGESTAQSGKSAYDIELLPKKKSDIRRAELQIEKTSSLPVKIRVEAKNGVSTTINISGIKTGMNQPDDCFVFNKKDYPDAEVIDLR